jgi:hypothetical protein
MNMYFPPYAKHAEERPLQHFMTGSPLAQRGATPRVRSHCRFRSRGTEYVGEYGIKWMRGSTKRQFGRALATPDGIASILSTNTLAGAAPASPTGAKPLTLTRSTAHETALTPPPQIGSAAVAHSPIGAAPRRRR